jgi:ubiquinone/menaquinone biosynthesis C-methylase UbiE
MSQDSLVYKSDYSQIFNSHLKKIYLQISDGEKLKSLLERKISLKSLGELQKKGAIYLEFPCLSKRVENFYKKGFSNFRNPLFLNISVYEKEWEKFDFLEKSSSLYYLKKFETEIYLEEMEKYLEKLKKNSLILDAGSGIGRFSIYFLKKGHCVYLVDSSKKALSLSFYYLSKTGKKNFNLYLGEVEDLSYFKDNSFDATISMEVICYVKNPEKALKELVRVTKKNGFIIISVEAKYGSIIYDTNIPLKYFEATYRNSSIYLKDKLYVNYYTEDSFKSLLKRFNLKILSIVGCHYTAEGILDRLVDPKKLKYRNYRDKLKKIEKLCRKDRYLKNLPRAYLGICIKR